MLDLRKCGSLPRVSPSRWDRRGGEENSCNLPLWLPEKLGPLAPPPPPSSTVSPTVLPQNVDFVIFMQFLSILTKLSPHKFGPFWKPFYHYKKYECLLITTKSKSQQKSSSETPGKEKWMPITGLQISVGHRTMTDSNKCLTNLKLFQSDIVSERKIITQMKYLYNVSV